MKAKNSTEKHFDKISEDYDEYKKKNKFYYDNIKRLLHSIIPSNKKVLEFGCGTGDLIASLNPKKGIGYDISLGMIKVAKGKYKNNKNLLFTNNTNLLIHKPFDYIFMTDVVEHLENPEATFSGISKLMNKRSQLVITMANPIWEPILMLAEKLNLKMPEGPHKRISSEELKLIFKRSKLKIIKHNYTLLVPVKIPIITSLANKYLEKYFKKFCVIEYFVVVPS